MLGSDIRLNIGVECKCMPQDFGEAKIDVVQRYTRARIAKAVLPDLLSH
jgi:hypothetical protein